MLIRLPFLLILLLSLAFGPVQLSAACVFPAGEVACGSCCLESEMACCAASDHSTPAKAPASVMAQSTDIKLLVSPNFVFIGLSPLQVVERPAFHRLQAARIPVPPRLDLTCIRLI